MFEQLGLSFLYEHLMDLVFQISLLLLLNADLPLLEVVLALLDKVLLLLRLTDASRLDAPVEKDHQYSGYETDLNDNQAYEVNNKA